MTLTPEQKELAAKALKRFKSGNQRIQHWEFIKDDCVLELDRLQEYLAEIGLAIQHVDASLPTVEQIRDIYQITKLRAALTEILEADKRGELHRDPLDTDEIFNQAKALLSIQPFYQ